MSHGLDPSQVSESLGPASDLGFLAVGGGSVGRGLGPRWRERCVRVLVCKPDSMCLMCTYDARDGVMYARNGPHAGHSHPRLTHRGPGN